MGVGVLGKLDLASADTPSPEQVMPMATTARSPSDKQDLDTSIGRLKLDHPATKPPVNMADADDRGDGNDRGDGHDRGDGNDDGRHRDRDQNNNRHGDDHGDD